MRRPGWLMIEDGCTLVMDKAPWHNSAEATAIFDQAELSVALLPAATGKWLNPCDQANPPRDARTFVRLQRERPHDKVRNIIAAYYALSEATVRGAWQHSALLEADYEERLRQASAEGFRPGAGREQEFEAAHQAWAEWISENLRSPTGALPSCQPTQLEGGALGGDAWNVYGRH